MIKSFLLALVLAASLASAAVAGPFEDGYAAYDKGDYATAMRLWRPLADQGNAEAQYSLGLMYDNGQGVPQDYAQACHADGTRSNAGSGKSCFQRS